MLQAGDELCPPSPCILGGAASGGGTQSPTGGKDPSAPYPIFCWDEVLQWPQQQWTGQVRGTIKKYQLPFSPSPFFLPTFLYTVTLNNITVVFSLLSLSKSNFFPTYSPGKGGHFRFLQWYLFICASQNLANFLEQKCLAPSKPAAAAFSFLTVTQTTAGLFLKTCFVITVQDTKESISMLGSFNYNLYHFITILKSSAFLHAGQIKASKFYLG